MKVLASLAASLILAHTALASLEKSAVTRHSHPLFKRQTGATASDYPADNDVPPASSLKKEWIDALNAAKAAGKIPDVPQTVLAPSGANTYPNGIKPEYCSWTNQKCFGPNDIQNAPAHEWGLSFDDGPTTASLDLYQFLQQNNQTATHFMIGTQIKNFPNAIQAAVKAGGQLALHTWSHTLLTTHDDLGVLGDLAWNMQIIYDLAGVIPNLYRPPQGDVDARVRAIATEVLGLTCVMWSDETNDWCLQSDGTSACPQTVPGKDLASVQAAVQKSLKGPQTPNGAILLEHELRPETVNVFKHYYPQLKTLGWKAKAIGDLGNGGNWYSNAKDGQSPGTPQSNILPKGATAGGGGSSSSAGASGSNSSSSTGRSGASAGGSAAGGSTASSGSTTAGSSGVATSQPSGAAPSAQVAAACGTLVLSGLVAGVFVSLF